MEIEDKYFKLLDCLIRDKRKKINGIITSIKIVSLIGGYYLCYEALNDIGESYEIFVEDIEKGNVVFLLPFRVHCFDKDMEELRKLQKQAIKEFFGDKFCEDMIMEISEEERQQHIREWEERRQGLSNWNDKFLIETIPNKKE